MANAYLFLTCAVLLAPLATSYPTGAPVDACTTLNPDSHGPSTAKGPSPFKVTFSSGTYKPGDIVTVTLTGAGFKGFLIVGRKPGDKTQTNVGYFQDPKDAMAHLLCIDGKDGNGVTHSNNTIKQSISLDWKAPSASVGDIVFHYTVVRGGAPSVTMQPGDYFMDLTSAPLKAAAAADVDDEVLRFEQEGDVAVMVIGDDEDGEEEIVYALPARERNVQE